MWFTAKVVSVKEGEILVTALSPLPPPQLVHSIIRKEGSIMLSLSLTYLTNLLTKMKQKIHSPTGLNPLPPAPTTLV